MSTMPMVPTPAAARYRAAGDPEAAGAEQEHPRVEELELALDVDLRQQQVALVAGALLEG